MPFVIRRLEAADLPVIAATNGGNGWHGALQRWEAKLQQQASGQRITLVALDVAQVIGYGSLAWQSQHPPFAGAGIPEIQDVVVATSHRGKGVGSRLIRALEQLALSAGNKKVGIGVGLYADYGSAQRLYARIGYIPDGHGITYRNAPAPGGCEVRVDDDLVLWMIKDLTAK
jgi:GNAT superfamily N-acetyltransferase